MVTRPTAQTAAALLGMIAAVRGKGLRLVTPDQLLASTGDPADGPGLGSR